MATSPQLADAIGMDKRIGRSFLNAGLGFGGGCLPKDIRAFMARAGELGADQALTFLREVDAINMRRRVRMVDLAREECGGSIAGRRIAVLGAAFKPHSDDVRDSPALSVAAQMQLQGASVVVTDPKAIANAAKKWPDLQFADTAKEAMAGAELVLVLTEWPEYVELDPAEAKSIVAEARVLDGRNCLDADGLAVGRLALPRARSTAGLTGGATHAGPDRLVSVSGPTPPGSLPPEVPEEFAAAYRAAYERALAAQSEGPPDEAEPDTTDTGTKGTDTDELPHAAAGWSSAPTAPRRTTTSRR